MNKITGHVQALTSWRSSSDPAPGMYSLGIDPHGTSQFFLSWNWTVNFWSSGEWNGNIFAGVPEMTSHYFHNFEFVSNANASYFDYSLQDPTVISRFVLDVSGQMRQLIWVPSADEWMIIWAEPHQLCDVYAVCGAFGVCDEKSEPFCSCPAGFRPSSMEDWELGDHSHGCRRNHPLQCDIGKDGDAFLLVPGISLPGNPSPPVEASSAQDCRLACLRSCDCNAYSYGRRCALWYGDLLNLQRRVDDTAGMDDLHLRLSVMDVSSKDRNRTAVFVSTASVASILVLCAIVSVFVKMFRRRQSSIRFMQAAAEGGSLVVFKYSELRRATKNFSEKLGGGGFGSVYRGNLPGGGPAVAVKRLEGLLCVGEKQFRNEVRTIGRIQHVNLVRLRGFSSHGSERLLVYDYMPNGSLDRALFGGAAAPPTLSWSARFQIALGTARGLLYLHEGCRDCIIHCDMKPENILLDEDLVPKVADFGMAKLVGRDFSRVLTTVRGTIGYLAPEWISGVPITAKADVYSYGMVLLEIISGRRNARCWVTTEQGDLLSEYFPLVAARNVSEGAALVALLDERLEGDADPRELERACRVACWCVQDYEAHRPTMEQVVQALEGVVAVNVPPIPTSLQAFAD
ncbi:G-type lectin S-receptor-like serine/threonine-protein kinase At2g19130 [Miscanthus floridulus]|uniref:G-type lectin S-receptor-like serine/threonine-protein kinase At2g19130 n=1 Tax=Miscanthus floridulus TaxID=154761 RepID=UPI0034579CDC